MAAIDPIEPLIRLIRYVVGHDTGSDAGLADVALVVCVFATLVLRHAYELMLTVIEFFKFLALLVVNFIGRWVWTHYGQTWDDFGDENPSGGRPSPLKGSALLLIFAMGSPITLAVTGH